MNHTETQLDISNQEYDFEARRGEDGVSINFKKLTFREGGDQTLAGVLKVTAALDSAGI